MFFFKKKVQTKHAKNLWEKGSRLIAKGKIDEAEKTLIEAVEVARNPIDKHFAYLKLMKLYEALYRKTKDKDVLNKLEKTCKNDIDCFPDFYEAWLIHNQRPMFPPNFPSFETLALLCESLGRTEEALKVCQLAVGYGQNSALPGGFEGIIKRLKDK